MSTSFKYVMLAALLLTLIASFPLFADWTNEHAGYWDSRHHYYRDNYGYYDDRHAYHRYIVWHGHHGYWDTRGSGRVFIKID